MKIFYIISLTVLVFLASCSEKRQEHAQPSGHEGMEDMVMLTPEEIIKANIQVDTARVKNISEEIKLTGIAAVNESKISLIASRLRGRLERVYIRGTGEYISKGKLLYDVYSEELLADENDYLLALQQYKNAVMQKETAKQLADAARGKLLSWTMSEEQIESLERTNSVSPVLSVFSRTSGYITELFAREGEYVSIGSPIMKAADISTIWVEMQVYSNELRFLNAKQVLIEFEIFPDRLVQGEIVFDNPSLEGNKKINLVRVKVDNKDRKLRPGIMAYIYLRKNEKKTLAIPKSALLVEKMISVWVQTSEGMFEPRMVTIGIENKSEVEIVSGLREGDIVVISGAYLLRSEQTVKEGSNSMGGMKM